MAGRDELPPEFVQALNGTRLAIYRLGDRTSSLEAVMEVNPERITDQNEAELLAAILELRHRAEMLLSEHLLNGPLSEFLEAAARDGIGIGELPDRLPGFWC